MAECHPVGFQWVTEARARGAKVIHVDPRFTRTTAVADRHLPIRAGSDVVLLGALINYVLSRELHFHDYVVAYTNAATLVNEDFQDTEDTGGLFSGFDPETGQYDPTTWAYAEPDGGGESAKRGTEHGESAAARAAGDTAAAVRRWTLPMWTGTRRCNTPARCSRSSSGTMPGTPRRWCSSRAASHLRTSSTWPGQ